MPGGLHGRIHGRGLVLQDFEQHKTSLRFIYPEYRLLLFLRALGAIFILQPQSPKLLSAAFLFSLLKKISYFHQQFFRRDS